jgi:outer membrane receptor protein involved in Fe transport
MYAVNAGSRTTVQGGVRWDMLRDDLSERRAASHEAWSPRVGATVAVGHGLTVFGQASRAFKAPTLDQLFDPRPFPDFQGGTFVISSSVLRPQRAGNLEGGIRQTTAKHRWEGVVYRMNVGDEIDFDPATFTYANIGRSVHEGIEFDAATFRSSPVSMGANYTWTRVAAESVGAGAQLKNIPRHLLRPDVTIRTANGIVIHARYTLTAGAFADDGNAVRLGRRSTLDVRVAKKFPRVTARVDLLNITNDRYEEVGYVVPDFRGALVPYFYPAPGFTARAGVELIF